MIAMSKDHLRSRIGAPLILVGVAVSVFIGSICIGAYPVPPGHVAKILISHVWPFSFGEAIPWSLKDQTVIETIRLPRVLLATLAGMGLGLSGTVLQGVMKNPLVSPDLLGVSAGAAFGCLLAMLFNFVGYPVVLGGLIGGMLALFATATIATVAGHEGGSLIIILAGLFVGAFFTALIGIVQYTADSEAQLPSMVYWTLGSFIGVDYAKVATLALPTIIGTALLILLRWRINLLSLTDIEAKTLGVNTSLLRWAILIVVACIVGAQVATCGMIGWIGLIVPHIGRMFLGPDHRRLVPFSAVIGATFTLILDDISRTAFPSEIPVGLLAAVVGTPFICLLLWRTCARGWIHG